MINDKPVLLWRDPCCLPPVAPVCFSHSRSARISAAFLCRLKTYCAPAHMEYIKYTNTNGRSLLISTPLSGLQNRRIQKCVQYFSINQKQPRELCLRVETLLPFLCVMDKVGIWCFVLLVFSSTISKEDQMEKNDQNKTLQADLTREDNIVVEVRNIHFPFYVISPQIIRQLDFGGAHFLDLYNTERVKTADLITLWNLSCVLFKFCWKTLQWVLFSLQLLGNYEREGLQGEGPADCGCKCLVRAVGGGASVQHSHHVVQSIASGPGCKCACAVPMPRQQTCEENVKPKILTESVKEKHKVRSNKVTKAHQYLTRATFVFQQS